MTMPTRTSQYVPRRISNDALAGFAAGGLAGDSDGAAPGGSCGVTIAWATTSAECRSMTGGSGGGTAAGSDSEATFGAYRKSSPADLRTAGLSVVGGVMIT